MGQRKIAILGVGNMGSAILRGCLSDPLFASDWTPLLIEREENKVAEFLPYKRVSYFPSIDDLKRAHEPHSLDACLLAIKPQDAESTLPAFASLLRKNATVISIMAGKSRATILNLLGENLTVVRAMPNLPIAVGVGMTVIHFDPTKDSEEARALVHLLFSKSGEILEAQDEQLLHPATALAGSGPGFLFHLLEAFVSEAIALGFSEAAAKHLTAQTVRGAIALYTSSHHALPELERQVTSPAGTTAAGIRVLKEENTQNTLRKCIREASRRSEELERHSYNS